jgi:hypothetical protein
MPIATDPSNPSGVVPSDDTPSHSRSSSMQSTTTTTDYDDKEEAKGPAPVPTIVQRDMEFFMARLTRTTSHDSTGSR